MNKRISKKTKKKILINFEQSMINTALLSKNEFVFDGKTYYISTYGNYIQTLINDRFLLRITENQKYNKDVNRDLIKFYNQLQS
ncbi:MAG: hypothetical protein K0R54_333 [Clostridiaceae bacterium]|jgi:hypothetical protein|nr:hypothetical protein [Clostridiaceae bacterium]